MPVSTILKDAIQLYKTKLISWAKRVTFYGLEGVAVYDVISFLVEELKRNVLTVRAKAITFSFFLALFPSILFVFTVIPFIPIPNLQENLFDLSREVLPQDAFGLIQQTIMDILSRPRGSLLGIGFFMALWISSDGMIGMMESFDKSLSTFTKRSAFKKRLIAIQLTLIIFFLLILSLLLIVAGNKFLVYILEIVRIRSIFTVILFTVLKFVILLLLFLFSISSIYYLGPATHKKWRFISTGSTVATLLVILISIGFSYFVNNFGQYNRFYGSIGTIIALQLWIYLNSFALLIGFELNTSISYHKIMREERELEDQK